jgi:hypothetical protein
MNNLPNSQEARDLEADKQWRKQRQNGQDHARITLVPFDRIKLGTDRPYLVKNLIPRVGLSVIWGPPKSGKSFWTFDLVMHVALGWEYRGRRVHQGPVVYCAFEGQSGIKARVEAFRQRHLAEQSDPVPFYVVTTVMDLAKDHRELIKAIKEADNDGPVAVVLDTLNRSLAGSEGKDEDMAAYIKAADAIRETFNCAVIVVHHCGVNESRPRGHTSLTGAADAQLAVKRDGSGTIVVTVEWMKDGAGEEETLASILESIEVGTDEDGEAITSCIVVESDYVPAKSGRRGKTLAKGAKIALTALQEAIAQAGVAAPASNHIPQGVRVVSAKLWKEYACNRGITGEETTEDAKRKAFTRAMTALIADGHVGNWQDHCWLA